MKSWPSSARAARSEWERGEAFYAGVRQHLGSELRTASGPESSWVQGQGLVLILAVVYSQGVPHKAQQPANHVFRAGGPHWLLNAAPEGRGTDYDQNRPLLSALLRAKAYCLIHFNPWNSASRGELEPDLKPQIERRIHLQELRLLKVAPHGDRTGFSP